jgi:hypothetical protein
MQVREDIGDAASRAAGQFGAPRSGIQMFDHKLVHPIVDRVTLDQRLSKRERIGMRTGHLDFL